MFPLVASIIDTERAVLQESTVDCFMFSDVTFVSDFGPWTKRQIVDCINFDFDKGIVTEYDRDGEIIKAATIRLIVI